MPFVLYALHCLLPDQQWNIGISNTSLSNVMVFCQIKKHAFLFFLFLVCLFVFFPPSKKIPKQEYMGGRGCSICLFSTHRFLWFLFFLLSGGVAFPQDPLTRAPNHRVPKRNRFKYSALPKKKMKKKNILKGIPSRSELKCMLCFKKNTDKLLMLLKNA
uniref:Uncharacterized protein n=1 Tax=Anguilla anguilla TaxID=7936 RepID=A0A0E9X872_ANGAN